MNDSKGQFKLTFEEFTNLDMNEMEINVIGTDNEYGLKYTLYKVQVKHPRIQTFYCARRYSEFYALNKVVNKNTKFKQLRIKYSNLDLPMFPSKHEIFNKVENRKVGFHLMLSRLVEISIEHPQIKQNILKLLYFFLTRELSGGDKQPILKSSVSLDVSTNRGSEDDLLDRTYNQIDERPLFMRQKTSEDFTKSPSIQKPRQPNQIEINLDREKKNFSGNLNVRFSTDEDFQQFYAKIKDGTLQLFVHISQNYFSCQIFLFQIQVDQTNDSILLYHDMDYKKIQIQIPQNDNYQKLDFPEIAGETTDKLSEWYYQLKIASKIQIGAEASIEEFNPVGKMQIHIRDCIKLGNIIQESFLLIRIKMKPFLCQTKQHVFTENPSWKQDFILPINDSYGVIEFELISEIQDGLLSRKIKQVVLGTAEILVADLLSYHSDKRFINLQLPLRRQDNENLSGPLSFLFKQTPQKQEDDPILTITIRNMSSPYSLFAAPPIHSYEGEKFEPDLTQLKMHIIRFKRIISLLAKFALQMEDIIDQKYPRFTLLFFTIMFIFIFFAEMNQILVYMVFGLIMIMVYQHPSINPIINHKLEYFFEPSPEYCVPRIYTLEEKDIIKSTLSLDKVFKFEGNELKIEDDDVSEAKDKESLFQKLKQIKKQYFVFQVYLTYFSNGAEKLINLFTWTEYKRTWYFFVLVFIAFLLLRAIPLRYAMLAGIINEWFDGKTVYKKRKEHNERIGKAVLEYIFKKFAPDIYNKDPKGYLQSELTPQLKLRIANELKMHLQISLSQEEMSKYNTAQEIVNDLVPCSQKLKVMGIIDNTFVRDPNYYDMRKQAKYKIKPHYLMLYTFSNFIYNIPSQYYRLRHPRNLEKLKFDSQI